MPDTLLSGQLAYCEMMGYDCGKHGADQKNCDFRLFCSPDHTAAWERGRAKAERDKRIQAPSECAERD